MARRTNNKSIGIKFLILSLLLATSCFVVGKEDKDNKDNGDGDGDDDDDIIQGGPGDPNKFDSTAPSDWPSLNPTSFPPSPNIPNKKDDKDDDGDDDDDDDEQPKPPSTMPTTSSVGFEPSLTLSPSNSIEMTSNPTVPPEQEEELVATLLPLMALSIRGPHDLATHHITAFVNEFLDDVLRNTIRQFSNNYSYIQTIVDVIQENDSFLVPTTEPGSMSQSEFIVEVAGFAYFTSFKNEGSVMSVSRQAGVPKRESLSRALQLYFSIWGVDDLNIAMDQSSVSDIRDAELVGLVIDNEVVYDDETTPNDEDEDLVITTNQNQKNRNLPLAILLISCAAVSFVALGIGVIFIHRLKRSRQDNHSEHHPKEVASPTKTDSAEDGESYAYGEKLDNIENIVVDDNRSVFDGDLSVVSMFTNNMDGMSIVGPPPLPPPPDGYGDDF